MVCASLVNTVQVGASLAFILLASLRTKSLAGEGAGLLSAFFHPIVFVCN